MADQFLEKLKVIRDSAYKISVQKFTDLYKDQAESDMEFVDCKFDMAQHVRFLEFRRKGCEIKLDDLKIESNALVEELGSAKDIMNTEITKVSSTDRAYKVSIWTIKFETYNNRVKAIKEVYKTLLKETYVAHGGVTNKTNIAHAKKHFNAPIEKDIIKNVEKTLATKH